LKDDNKLNKKIETAVDTAQRAQRNYDLSVDIPSSDLNTLIYAATNSPSKQNETHYQLHVITDSSIIYQIYNQTKKFTLGIKEALDETKGEEWLYMNKSVKNSQVNANALFVYVDDDGSARGATHLKGKHGEEFSKQVLDEQKNYSVGISVGELILSSALLGYKSGICSAFDVDQTADILKTDKQPRLLVGVGVDSVNTERTLHSETYNKDLPVEYRTGDLDQKWQFPSFEKQCKVYLNNVEYSNKNA